MPVKPGSRYARAPIYEVTGPDQKPRRVIGILWRKEPPPAGESKYQLRQRDDIDLLSYRFFGSEQLWWRILDANPLVHPFDLEPGTVLEIPNRAASSPTTRARKF